VQLLLQTVSAAPGSRNLLLLEDRTAGSSFPELPVARWGFLIRDAVAASVAIHAVALIDPGGSPGVLAEVAAQTGGICLSATDPGRVPALCEKLFAVLLHPYEILYRPEVSSPRAPLKLEVYAQGAHGEDVLHPEGLAG
jgi:hypothetical protein